MKPKLIAICSPCMGSGKTEIAQRLVDKHGFRLVKFAGGVKAMVFALLAPQVGQHLATDMVDGDLKELPSSYLQGETPRRVMQTLGTEWGRNTINPDLWVAHAMRQVDGIMRSPTARIVIDDMRFTNELLAVEERKGLLVRVTRPGAQPYQPHASEGQLDGWPMHEVANAGTLADLHELADGIANG